MEINPSVSKRQKDFFSHIQDQYTETPEFIIGSLSSVIDRGRLQDYNLAFFDFMGDYFGNQSGKRFPIMDLLHFLQANRRQYITLAFTVSINPRNGRYFHTEDREKSVLDHFHNVLLRYAGYHIEIFDASYVKRYISRQIPMLFVCCNLSKCTPDVDVEWPYYINKQTGLLQWCGFPPCYQDS